MRLRTYLILMTVSTVALWLGWFLVINYIDPTTAGLMGFIFFYLSLLLALTGTISIIGLLIRSTAFREESILEQVEIALRQGIMLALMIVGLLLLQSQRLLTWWNIILLILALTILEFFFISSKRQI